MSLKEVGFLGAGCEIRKGMGDDGRRGRCVREGGTREETREECGEWGEGV